MVLFLYESLRYFYLFKASRNLIFFFFEPFLISSSVQVISLYPEKEVKKGLEQLYKKIEKHLIVDSPLLQVVWRNMQVSICHASIFYSLIRCLFQT